MNEIKKTGYEWCLETNIRLLNLETDWPTDKINYKTPEQSYFTEKISSNEFLSIIEKCTVKTNSLPRKTTMFLEYRMYGLVPYNMSQIQQGIQFGHAVVDYGRSINGIHPAENIYNKWADFDKTFIILNGGTTNNNPERLGSLNKHLNTLRDNGIMVTEFNEPDLGDQLTAIVFLVDERVFNKDLYPDFIRSEYTWPRNKEPYPDQLEAWEEENKKNYANWVVKIGGEKNAFLREFLKTFRLA